MSDIVVNELLCFMHNKYGSAPNGKSQFVISGFYFEDELLAAKTKNR